MTSHHQNTGRKNRCHTWRRLQGQRVTEDRAGMCELEGGVEDVGRELKNEKRENVARRVCLVRVGYIVFNPTQCREHVVMEFGGMMRACDGCINQSLECEVNAKQRLLTAHELVVLDGLRIVRKDLTPFPGSS